MAPELRPLLALLLLLLLCSTPRDCLAARGLKQGQYGMSKSLKNGGLFPSVFNVASKAEILVNATCGEDGPESFCKPSESSRCGVCDSRSPDPNKRHNINQALDSNPSRWWQSPTLARGDEFEYITIVLDLKQMYQIEYIIVKAANSPRPAAWILERSNDGENFLPWQYYAPTDEECWTRYSMPPVLGKPTYTEDNEVICTSFYSRQTPMENGEIHTHLVNGRPGAANHTQAIQDFTQARYVRLRFQGLRRRGEFFVDKRRAFYSIREINIGGRCLCSGHASRCKVNGIHKVQNQECECERHTCGEMCEKCCPMYNQVPWKPGTSGKGFHCEKCNCNGHATSCRYDPEVAELKASMDIRGKMRGGGVCQNCSEHTTGVNCEKCVSGYYRPDGTLPNDPEPCVPCDCHARGSTGNCMADDSLIHLGKVAGACECRQGYSGHSCNQCAAGFRQFPDCVPCPCDSRGVLASHDCEGDCLCKAHVIGEYCDRCKPGYFALERDNPDGCLACVCSGVSSECTPAKLSHSIISTLEGWQVSDINASRAVSPSLQGEHGWPTVAAFEVEYRSPYWLAPKVYAGNHLSSYGSNLTFIVSWIIMRGDTSGKPTSEPDVVLIGKNGMRIAYGEESHPGQEAEIDVPLVEQGWFHVSIGSETVDGVTRFRRTDYRGEPVTRHQMLAVLAHIEHVLIRAQFHTEQFEGSLKAAMMPVGEVSMESGKKSLVEMCSCPVGYAGLSCESCDWGYVKVSTNSSSHPARHKCVKCDCNGHAASCNLMMGECSACEHNTIGPKCDRCAVGYYGDATRGTPGDCLKCACPLEVASNNFSPSCQIDNPNDSDSDYVCTQCPVGYTGDHCEICDVGFFGNPLKVGSKCEPCPCFGGPCDQETGRCLECRGNTEGWKCEKCKEAHYGDPTQLNCLPCACDPLGSSSAICEAKTGQCSCRALFTGRDCSACIEGYGNVTAGCVECDCGVGAQDDGLCHPVTGLCSCSPGTVGPRCDRCDLHHYGLSFDGCNPVNGEDGFKLTKRATRVAPGEFPFLVSIQINGQHTCGGSLISVQHVLTAAHCVDGQITRPDRLYTEIMTVEVGSVQIGAGKTHNVIRLSRTKDEHENTNVNNLMSPGDIGVITLATPVETSDYVKIIALPPNSYEVSTGAQVVASGFGTFKRQGPTSPILLKTTFIVVRPNECYQYFYESFGQGVLDSSICAKRGPGYGVCMGDSGGPLIYNKMVVGVTSAVHDECGSGYPDGYTKVSNFLPYINYELGKNGGSPDRIPDNNSENVLKCSSSDFGAFKIITVR